MINVSPTAKVICRVGKGLVSHLTDRRSKGSNSGPLGTRGIYTTEAPPMREVGSNFPNLSLHDLF